MNAVRSLGSNDTSCPRCKKQGALRRCMVNRHNIVYRCSACRTIEMEPLPRFPKQIVYLDQCALSNIAKQKDTFWAKLHKKLNDLIGLQLIACPWSRIHREESMLTVQWRDQLQTLYKQLAGDDQFRSPDEIELAQLQKVLHCYLGQAEASKVDDRWREALKEDPHRFTGDMIVTCHFPANELVVTSVSQRKQSAHNGMEEVGNYWKQNPQCFRKAVEAEIEGYGRNLIAAYRELANGPKQIEGMLSGELLEVYRSLVRPGEFNPKTPPGLQSGVQLVHWLACEVQKVRLEENDPVSIVEDFFKSKFMSFVPFIDIQSRLWASIAMQTQSDKHPRNPKSSDGYDVDAVSYYAPYCDAMFLDEEFRGLASKGTVDVPGRYHVKLFSAKHRNEFMDYLEHIRQLSLVPEHIERLALVYPEWAALVPHIAARREMANAGEGDNG